MVALLSTTIIRIASSNIPALIVTSHCCSYVRRDGNWIGIGFGQDPGQAGKSRALHLVPNCVRLSPLCRAGETVKPLRAGHSARRAGRAM